MLNKIIKIIIYKINDIYVFKIYKNLKNYLF